ncbi:MAG: Fic family protein [Bacteroidia bacterium]|jgi:Fic family protein|nr:Fic family protein [Bacteroidia bacterium]
MGMPLYTFSLDVSFELMSHSSSIDRFVGEWASISRREGVQTLKQLKSIATVESTGASTRIEGSRLTNDEVKVLIFEKLKIEKLEDRDEQEVKGYFHTLDIISDAYNDIEINETSLKSLHNELLRFSDKDQWHKGNYKQHTNSVEATSPDGSKVTVFTTTSPGVETEDAMRALIEWYRSDKETPLLIKTAAFVYEFLTIHPFQDGNGRMSRLLGTLLLLKNGYEWIQYVSFEHEIEQRKSEYYKVLMECQHGRPGEDITPWVHFFLDCMTNILEKLKRKLDVQKREAQMSPREKMIFAFIDNHPGASSGVVSQKLNIPLPTVKRILTEMVTARFLLKHGAGAGTNYTTERVSKLKSDVAQTLTRENPVKEFVLKNRYEQISIKKIVLTPEFEWQRPNDWFHVLIQQAAELKVSCFSSKGRTMTLNYSLPAFVTPYHYQPVFTLNNPIQIPDLFWDPNDNEFPLRVELKIGSNHGDLKFGVILVYDAFLDTEG